MSQPYKILLVEDNEGEAETLTKLLNRAAPGVFEIHSVGTLADALRVSREIEADLTLLDLQLPDATWQETAAAIDKFFPPVIVVTSMPPREVEVTCMANGAERVFDKADVLRVVEVLVGEITRAILRSLGPRLLLSINGN